MATIVKKESKNGVSYKVQVKIKNKGSGEIVVKSTTWKPTDGMGLRQQAKEVRIFADTYEEQIRQSVNSGVKIAKYEMTFKELAAEWVEKIRIEYSLNYYVKCKDAIDVVNRYIGGYKARELTPNIIQNCYDKLDQLEKKIQKVVPKVDCIRAEMASSGIGYMELRYKLKTSNSCSIDHILQGMNVRLNTAESIAAVYKVPVGKLFIVTETKQKYAYETIHKIKRTVRAILSYAKKQRLVDENYAKADYINFTPRPETEIICMNEEEAKQFYKTLNDYPDIRYKTAMMLTILTGFRRGEVCGLEWKDINWTDNEISVVRSLTAVKGFGVICKSPKTKSSKRTISIPTVLTEQLKQYKIWQDNEKTLWGDKWIENDRLFTQQNGDRINPSMLRPWLDKVCKAAGLPHVTMHSLRHTNITLQIIAGVPLIVVSGRAGHAKTSTTTDVYSHFLKSNDKIAADKINDIFN